MASRHRLSVTAALFLVAQLSFADDKPMPPQITAIHPTANTLPANHLKFYLHFSQPMRQGVFLDHCKLLDDHGQPVTEPFRETELWNEDGTRLTLWFHPGRQKTGVNLNVDLGPIVEPKRRYKLVISGAWPSADGIRLGRVVEKFFVTSDRVTTQLDITAWKIMPPDAGTKKPLEVHFPAPLDHALLLRCLRVADERGGEWHGTSSTADTDKVWRFTPEHSWTPGTYAVLTDSILEDLAGNSLARPFQVNVNEPAQARVPPVLRREFTITPR